METKAIMVPSAEAEAQMAGVVDFWFEQGREMTDATIKRWFQGGAELDAEVSRKFGAAHAALRAGAFREMFTGEAATGATMVAYIIVADQFGRNIHRGTADAFATDSSGLEAARAAVDRAMDVTMSDAERLFMYLPFVHSESRVDLHTGLALMKLVMPPPALGMTEEHFAVIQQFGRYPYRNSQVGRESTAEELERPPDVRPGQELD